MAPVAVEGDEGGGVGDFGEGEEPLEQSPVRRLTDR